MGTYGSREAAHDRKEDHMSDLIGALVCMAFTVTLSLLVISVFDPNEPKEGN